MLRGSILRSNSRGPARVLDASVPDDKLPANPGTRHAEAGGCEEQQVLFQLVNFYFQTVRSKVAMVPNAENVCVDEIARHVHGESAVMTDVGLVFTGSVAPGPSGRVKPPTLLGR